MVAWEYTWRFADRQNALEALNAMGKDGWEAVFFRKIEKGPNEGQLGIYYKRQCVKGVE